MNTATAMTARSALGARWQALAPRERLLTGIALLLVAVAAVFALAVQPAWRTVRHAAAEHARLDAQLQRMQQLKAQAQALSPSGASSASGSSAPNAQPPRGGNTAAALEASVKQRLGDKAQVQVAGERATIRFSAVPPESLARWLQEARVNARALPQEAQLSRSAAGQWDGTLVMTLPQP